MLSIEVLEPRTINDQAPSLLSRLQFRIAEAEFKSLFPFLLDKHPFGSIIRCIPSATARCDRRQSGTSVDVRRCL